MIYVNKIYIFLQKPIDIYILLWYYKDTVN